MIVLFTRCLACVGVLSLAVHADLFNLQDYSTFTSQVHAHNAAVFTAVPPSAYTGSSEPPPPLNDNFANRTTISGMNTTTAASNTDATRETGEPFHNYVSIAPGPGANSIWFTWTAPANGTFGIDTRGTLFNTTIAVYRGSTLHSLERVKNGTSYVYFNATLNETYQIAVSGASSFDAGNITLNMYPDGISPEFTSVSVTSSVFLAQASPDGSIVTSPGDVIYHTILRTNRFGIVASGQLKNMVYPQGLTFTDRKNTVILNSVHPPGIGTAYRVMAFNGKYVYIYDQMLNTLHVFKVSSKGLKPMGSKIIVNFGGVVLYKSKVYVLTADLNLINIMYSSTGMSVFDRKLKKLQFSLPIEPGYLRKTNIQKDVFAREQYNTYTIDLRFTSRSDEIHTRSIEYPSAGTLFFSTDKKGGLFYWTRPFAAIIGTGCPVSYLDKDGVLVLNNTLLEGRTDISGYVPYTLDYVYGVIPDVSQAHLVAYRIGKKIKMFNRQSVPDYASASTSDSMLFAQQMSFPGGVGNTGFIAFDKKLKKPVWAEPQAEGLVTFFDSKTAVRVKSAPSGSSTVYTYKIFNRKKTVAEHNFIQ